MMACVCVFCVYVCIHYSMCIYYSMYLCTQCSVFILQYVSMYIIQYVYVCVYYSMYVCVYYSMYLCLLHHAQDVECKYGFWECKYTEIKRHKTTVKSGRINGGKLILSLIYFVV